MIFKTRTDIFKLGCCFNGDEIDYTHMRKMTELVTVGGKPLRVVKDGVLPSMSKLLSVKKELNVK